MTNGNTNLAIWNQVEQTDPEFTKEFNRGGGFKGTSTNATYLAKKATNMFGPIGIGWGWTVVDEKYQPGNDKDVVHVIRIKLWYFWGEKKGEIEHFGQTQYVGKNRNGYYTDEEAPKKSLTDAVSKCLSLLGFAADIHLGMYDDNRYVNDLKRNFGDEFDGRNNANDNDRDRDRDQDRGRDSGGDRGSLSKKDEGKGKRKASVSDKEQDEILDKWEATIKSAKTVKAVMEAIADPEFAPDMEKLHEDDEKYIRDQASKKSQELKTAKTKDAPKDADAA